MVLSVQEDVIAGRLFPPPAAVSESQPCTHALRILLMQAGLRFEGMKVLEGITAFFFENKKGKQITCAKKLDVWKPTKV